MGNLNIQFRDKFGEFEKYIKEKYGVNELSDDVFEEDELKDNKVLWKHCRALRNIYSHGGIDFADINPEKLEEFCVAVDKIMNPRKAIDICVKENKVFKATINNSAETVISEMVNKNYTCTPIVNDNKKVIGVFSADSFMLWANTKGEIAEDFKQLSINDILEFCKLDGHKDIEYKFISRNTKEDEIRKIFKQYYKNNKRLEAIFVTQSGKQEESLLGIITHWDLQ